MIAYLEKALNIRRNEFVAALLLSLYLFLVIASYKTGTSVAKGLFLKTFLGYYSHAILGTALLSGLFVSIYIHLSHRIRLERLIIGTLLFFSLSFTLLWWLTRFYGKWVYPLIWVWVYTAGVMGPTMGWTLANYLLTSREARRIFGFIGAGAILGGIFAGFFTATATRFVQPPTLLLAMTLFLTICAVLVKVIFWRTPQRLEGLELAPAAGEGVPKSFFDSLALIQSARYLRLVTALIGIGSVTTTIIEFQFSTFAATISANEAALTAFFGKFDGYMGAGCFLLQLILTGRLLRSLGIRVTLFVLPVVFLGGSLAVLLAPTLLTVCILKGSHSLLRYSLDKSSAEMLYLPVPPDIKSQVKSFIDTFIWRLADGVAATVLWVSTSLLKLSPGRVSLLNFVFLGSWIAIAYGVRREYLNVLRRAIERRELDPEGTTTGLLDGTSTTALRGLLSHSSPSVRHRALRLLGDAGDREILPQVQKMLADESPEVRTEVIHYLVLHDGRDPLDVVESQTDLPDYSLQGSVVAYLAGTGQPENLDAARFIFDEMLRRTGLEAVPSRTEAARVLGMIPPPSELHSHLPNLLRDEDPDVVEQALLSAGNIQDREFLPLVIEKLGQFPVATSARVALVQYGERAVGTLQDYLKDPATPLPIRKQIPRVLARIPTSQSAAGLVNSLVQSDPGLRFDILKALNKLRRRDSDLVSPKLEFEAMLQVEVIGYYRSFQILAAVDARASSAMRAPSSEPPLTRALRERMDHELERIFRLLALLYPPRDIHNAFAGLTSSRPQLQANALEVLEHLLRPDLYRLLAFVLDPETTLQQKLSFAQQLCRTSVASQAEALRILLHSEDRWLRACALHAVGEWRLAELATDLQQVPHETDALLEETRKWASARLARAATA